jgi:hypothetical protein
VKSGPEFDLIQRESKLVFEGIPAAFEDEANRALP